MPSTRVLSSQCVPLFLQVLRRRGIPVASLRRDYGLEPAVETWAEAGLPLHRVAAFAEDCATLAKDPLMGPAEVSGAKIFQMEYRNAKGAPSDKATEVASMMRAVSKATGSKLDVVTHSAGGHDFRQYLDTRKGADADVAINRAVMIGPVSHGTVMGNIGDVAGGLVGVKKAAGELGIGDPLVKHLDQTWDKQRSQIAKDVTVIAISGAPTAGPGGVQTGDGFVQVDEIDLAKSKTVVLHGADPTPIAHLKEVGYSGVINQVGAALGQD